MNFSPEKELKDFPCSFNLATGSKVSHQRLQHVIDNVRRDLYVNDCMPEERIRNLNLLTWALFRLNDKKGAQDINTEVLGMTDRINGTALGNSVFISCGLGNRINGKTYFTELQNLAKSDENYEITALGEQAYSYSRLGGVENYMLCLSLFKKCIIRCPENYLWKFGLGLMNRRLTNYNLHSSSPDKMDVHEITKECASLLFDVAENAKETRLRGLAYAQLVQLRQYNGGHQQDRIFKNKSIQNLLKLALKYGGKNPTVLTVCGKSIKRINIDDAIDLLRNSLKLRENATAYHHLGVSLLKKVDLMTNGKYSSKPTKYVRQLTFSTASNIDQRNSPNYQADYAQAKTERLDSRFRSNETDGPKTFEGVESSQSAQPRPQSVIDVTNNSKIVQIFNSNKARDLLSEQFQNTLHLNEQHNAQEPRRCSSQGASNFHQTSARENKGKIFYQRNVNPSNKNPFLRPMSLEERSSYSLSSMTKFAKSPTKKLDKDNELVKEALQNYEKSIEVSQEENVPARLSLGDLYMRLDQFQEALAQYNLILDKPSEDYLVNFITANECAGKCLLKLSEMAEDGHSESFRAEAKETFKKALSLAADLAIRNPLYANCEIEVWEAFRRLKADVEQIPSQSQRRYKEKIALLELAKNKDIANVIREMLGQGLQHDDIELFQKGLNCYLREGKFEDAIAFLNIACTKSCLTKNDAWTSSEIMSMRSTTYIATSWERLTKSSPDFRRVFQQMFHLRYGDCAGMISGEDEDESEIKKSDVLIVNDESADSEEQPGLTTTLARNLARVFKVIFGLDTANNLERNVEYGRSREQIQLEEMEKYSLVVLIIGDQDSKIYKRMLEATHMPSDPNIVVIFSCRNENCLKKILTRNKSVDMSDDHWQQTKLLDPPPAQDSFTSEAVDKTSILATLKTFFDDKLEAVLRLFCLLVDEDFKMHQSFFENPSKYFLVEC